MSRMKQLREELGITMKDAAHKIGLPYTTYVNYEKGEREPNSEMLITIANFYGTSIDYLVGKTDERNLPTLKLPDSIIPMPVMKTIPLLGNIACGEPILASENLAGGVSAPESIHADFALRCRGDSMIYSRIFDGDIVYIRQQNQVENGEIAAVLIDDEATLKRVRLFDDHISLEPENPLYKPLVLWGEDMNRVRILGKAVAFTSTVH